MLNYLKNKFQSITGKLAKELTSDFKYNQYKSIDCMKTGDRFVTQSNDIIEQDMMIYWCRIVTVMLSYEILESRKYINNNPDFQGFVQFDSTNEEYKVTFDEVKGTFVCDTADEDSLYSVITTKLESIASEYDRMTFHLYNKVMELFREYEKANPGEGVLEEDQGVHALNYAYRGDWDVIDNDIEKAYQAKLPKLIGTHEYPWFFEYCLLRENEVRRFWAVHYSVFTPKKNSAGNFAVEDDLDMRLDLDILIDTEHNCIRHKDWVMGPQGRFVHKDDLVLYS